MAVDGTRRDENRIHAVLTHWQRSASKHAKRESLRIAYTKEYRAVTTSHPHYALHYDSQYMDHHHITISLSHLHLHFAILSFDDLHFVSV